MAEQHPMTEAMYYILLALLKPGHGYGMMQRIRELSGGRLEMGPGTLYGVLSRMNREGWIVLTGEEGRRKTYAITEAGKTPSWRSTAGSSAWRRTEDCWRRSGNEPEIQIPPRHV